MGAVSLVTKKIEVDLIEKDLLIGDLAAVAITETGHQCTGQHVPNAAMYAKFHSSQPANVQYTAATVLATKAVVMHGQTDQVIQETSTVDQTTNTCLMQFVMNAAMIAKFRSDRRMTNRSIATVVLAVTLGPKVRAQRSQYIRCTARNQKTQ